MILDESDELYLAMLRLMELWDESDWDDEWGWYIVRAALIHITSQWVALHILNKSSVAEWERNQ
jgi:hypothetical protein